MRPFIDLSINPAPLCLPPSLLRLLLRLSRRRRHSGSYLPSWNKNRKRGWRAMQLCCAQRKQPAPAPHPPSSPPFVFVNHILAARRRSSATRSSHTSPSTSSKPSSLAQLRPRRCRPPSRNSRGWPPPPPRRVLSPPFFPRPPLLLSVSRSRDPLLLSRSRSRSLFPVVLNFFDPSLVTHFHAQAATEARRVHHALLSGGDPATTLRMTGESNKIINQGEFEASLWQRGRRRRSGLGLS